MGRQRAVTVTVAFLVGAGLILCQPAHARRARGNKCLVFFHGVEREWAEGFRGLCETAVDGYQEIFGVTFPAPLWLIIRPVEAEQSSLYTDSERRIWVDLADIADLAPDSSYNWTYGVAHEIGHIALHQYAPSGLQVPEDVDQGFAHYAGSVVLDYIWEQLGPAGYPTPFDYSWVGTPRLDHDCGSLHRFGGGSACVFRAASTQGSHEEVLRALETAMDRADEDHPLIGEVRAEVAGRWGEPAIAALGAIEPQLPAPLEGEGDHRACAGGGSEPEWHRCGTGTAGELDVAKHLAHQAVAFHLPGPGRLVGIQAQLAEFDGQPERPALLWVLDGSFQPIARLPGRSAVPLDEPSDWVPLLGGDYVVHVPEDFVVCVDSDGDGSIVRSDPSSTGHSFMAAPGGALVAHPDGDWMIRVRVVDDPKDSP